MAWPPQHRPSSKAPRWTEPERATPPTGPHLRQRCRGRPQGVWGAVGIDSYLRIWASCRPPPPRGRRCSRSPGGPFDGAPCSPSRRDPVGRTGRSNAAATAAAPWPLPAEEKREGKTAARDRAQARRPCPSWAPAISAA